jgi:hypothetical protein
MGFGLGSGFFEEGSIWLWILIIVVILLLLFADE